LFYIGIAIAANKFKEWRRRQMRVAPLSGDSSSEDKRDQEEAGIRKPWKEGGTQNREENEAVRQLTFSELLAGLSSDCKQVILLHNEGKSDKEIQQELGLPSANAVAARRSYCLKHLFDVKRGIQR
jgi:DNA-directed RNA polymerase specialized sigma24 family protein